MARRPEIRRGGQAMSDESQKVLEHAAWTPKVELLLQDWRKRVYAAQAAYYQEVTAGPVLAGSAAEQGPGEP